MSLKPSPIAPVPEETRRVAQAAFPKGNLYLTIRDKLGAIFQDEDFVDLYPADGQPALPLLGSIRRVYRGKCLYVRKE
jgi:transposase